MLNALTCPPATFQRRREHYMSAMAENAIAIIPANVEVTRSRDTEYAFRQSSDFHYFTGFPEPDAFLVMLADEKKSILFVRDKDELAEIWTGRRYGAQQAQVTFGVDEAYPLSEFDERALQLLNKRSSLYYARGVNAAIDQRIFGLIDQLAAQPKRGFVAPATVTDSRLLGNEMRLIKDNDEIAIMREAGRISAEAHCLAMKASAEGVTEYQLEAEILYHFAKNGARQPAYASIVGAGDNACILHYTENADVLQNDELVLIDAGCELQGYAADITRTFPANGKFTEPQKALYQIVLDAQEAAIAECVPGNTFEDAKQACLNTLVSGLVALDILQGDVGTLIKEEAFKPFFMHGLGHWLGLDVHDVGEYKRNGDDRPFVPGMVFTIEPGLYFSPTADVEPKYRGIGIRIEDNILITDAGHENLTAGVPKTIEAIEALMA